MRTRSIDKQELVKQKTIEMIVSDGLDGFSINKLAMACEISVATLYIYYKDKEDLILTVALEEAQNMSDTVMKGFDPKFDFQVGLKHQWKTRSRYMLDNPQSLLFFEHLSGSVYQEKVFEHISKDFKKAMGAFMKNAISNKQIDPMPMEVYWSVAFAPLYNLMRFHHEGRSIGGQPFSLKDKFIWQTFALVLKALKPS